MVNSNVFIFLKVGEKNQEKIKIFKFYKNLGEDAYILVASLTRLANFDSS